MRVRSGKWWKDRPIPGPGRGESTPPTHPHMVSGGARSALPDPLRQRPAPRVEVVRHGDRQAGQRHLGPAADGGQHRRGGRLRCRAREGPARTICRTPGTGGGTFGFQRTSQHFVKTSRPLPMLRGGGGTVSLAAGVTWPKKKAFWPFFLMSRLSHQNALDVTWQVRPGQEQTIPLTKLTAGPPLPTDQAATTPGLARGGGILLNWHGTSKTAFLANPMTTPGQRMKEGTSTLQRNLFCAPCVYATGRQKHCAGPATATTITFFSQKRAICHVFIPFRIRK